jgi:hypothetical protein
MGCAKNDPSCPAAAITIAGIDAAAVSKDQLRTAARMGLSIAAALAKITNTDADDKAVAFLQQAVDNDTVWNLVCSLLGIKEVAPAAPDNGEDHLRLMGATPVEGVDFDKYIPEHLPNGVTREMVKEKLRERYGDMKALPVGLIGLIIKFIIALLAKRS